MDAPSPLDIANGVLAHLPQELRDTVYSHLWDTETLAQLSSEYPLLLVLRNQACEECEDDDGNVICLCDAPESESGVALVPEFARAVFVGCQFAGEAVKWLYENWHGFVVNRPEEVMQFLVRDVFHVGVSARPFQNSTYEY
jgi:hypothetical protein